MLSVQTVILLKQKHKIDIYESAFKNLPVGIYIKDLSGKIIISNEQMSQILGYDGKNINNKYAAEIFPDGLADTIKECDNTIIKTGKPLCLEKVYLPANKTTHHYRVTKAPIYNKTDIIGFVTVFKNVDKGISIDKQKDSFIADLAHDLKTPTNALERTLNLLLNKSFGHLNKNQHEMLHLSKLSCTYMSDLIGTIVDTYRYDYGNLTLKSQHVDIIYMIDKLCKSVQVLAEERGQEIIFKNDLKSCFVYCDELQIKRVILNLLSNAISYGFQNSSIIISVTCTNDKFNLSVTNKSFPIPGEQLANIFDKFATTKQTRLNKASTSLGLYLSKQIIDLHGGKMYAESTDDGLCIFGFTINANSKVPALANNL